MIGDLGSTFPAGRAQVGALLWTLRRVPKPASLLFGKQTLPAVAGVAGDGVISRTGPPPASPPASPASKTSPPQSELTASEFQALQGLVRRASLVCQTGMENILSRL